MMKRTHKGLTRLLSAGLSLALLTTLLPGAMAARSRTMDGYDVDAGDTLEIDADDFYDFCDDYADSGDEMYSISFSELPAKSEGILYYYDEDNDDHNVKVDDDITYSNFSYLVFEADEDCSGTVSIDFEIETYDYDYISGTLEIEVNSRHSTSSDDLEYDIDVNEEFDLVRGDLDYYCVEETNRGEQIDYITFTSLPSSSHGTLYYDYDGSDEEVIEEDVEYSRSELRYMTFVPKRNYEGTVTLSFEGEADSRETFDGKITINVGDGRSSSVSAKTGDVTLYTDVDEEIWLDEALEDFDDYACESTREGEEIEYLWFTSLPDKDEGVLYYDDPDDGDVKVSKNDSFPRGEIDYVYFVPDRDFEGPVTIPFEGEANSGEEFDGDLVINVGVSDEAEVTVELQGATGSPLTFQAADFNDACLDATGSNLNYVEFDFTSGRGGYLYYKYDEGYEDEVGSARYYRSASPSLDDVTFVPGSATGSTVRIPFEGCSTNNKRFSGEVEIHLVALQSPGVVRYTSDGTAVRFKASDFSAACAARGGESLVSVQFTVPDTTGGQLYYNFTSPAKYRGVVVSSITYSVSGLYMLDLVSFLPRAEYTGTITIPYVGTDAAGITFNGTVEVTVNSPTATTRFNDMANYSWAVPGVEFMAAYGITTGTGNGSTFSPGDKLTRGDYVLMLVRAFGFTSTSTANFNDVPADSWYTEALAIARAQGIIEADANGNFRPTEPVTREDSMLYLYRAMQKSGRTIANAYDTYLSRYPDGASVSDYARSAMAALTQAGIIQGDQAGRLNPQNTLTRAEMAVILHRGLTM